MRLLIDILYHSPFSDLFEITEPRSRNEPAEISFAHDTHVGTALNALAAVVALKEDAEKAEHERVWLRQILNGTDDPENVRQIRSMMAYEARKMTDYKNARITHIALARAALEKARVSEPEAYALLLTMIPPDRWLLVQEAIGNGAA